MVKPFDNNFTGVADWVGTDESDGENLRGDWIFANESVPSNNQVEEYKPLNDVTLNQINDVKENDSSFDEFDKEPLSEEMKAPDSPEFFQLEPMRFDVITETNSPIYFSNNEQESGSPGQFDSPPPLDDFGSSSLEIAVKIVRPSSGPLLLEGDAHDNNKEPMDSAEVFSSKNSSSGKMPRVRRYSRKYSTNSEETLGSQRITRRTKKEMQKMSKNERDEHRKETNARSAQRYKFKNEAEIRELQEERDSLKEELEALEGENKRAEGDLWYREYWEELCSRKKEIANTISFDHEETLEKKRESVFNCKEKLEEIEANKEFLTTRTEISTNGSQKFREKKKLLRAETDLEVHELEAKIELERKYQKLLKDYKSNVDHFDENPAGKWNSQLSAKAAFAGTLLENDVFDDAGRVMQPLVSDIKGMDLYPNSGMVGGTSLAPRDARRESWSSSDDRVHFYPP